MDFTLDVFKHLPLLAPLAQAGSIFQVGQVVSATAILSANFALFNKSGNGLQIWLLAAPVQVAAAIEVDLFRLDTDPAMTAGNTPVNLLLGFRNAGATFEAQQLAAPATNGKISAMLAAPANTFYVCSSGVIIIPPGKGILISTGLVATQVSLTLVWAEIDAAFTDWLAQRDDD